MRIDSNTPHGRVDFRTSYADLRYSLIPVPDDVSKGVAALMRRFGLVYAALDFVLDDAGRWLLLEVNPNGSGGT